MIRKILNIKEKSLHEPSKAVGKVDKKIHELIEDMKDTLAAQEDPEGVGLAAPQIGKNLRVFLIRYNDTEKVIINPKITKIEKVKKSKSKSRSKLLEGCLSLPHYYGPLKRDTKVTLEYMDETGKSVTEVFNGFLAQIVQHEVDHLDGILFIDRILEQNAPLYHFHGDEYEEVELI
jgi:peptide deformylase